MHASDDGLGMQEKGGQLVQFDNEEIILEVFESEYSSLNKSESETQKRRRDIKVKFEKYLNHHQPFPTGRSHRESIDGQLIDYKNDIAGKAEAEKQNERFTLLFNKKPAAAIRLYVQNGQIHQDSASAIAQYIAKAKGIDFKILGEYFGQKEPQTQAVLRAFCNILNFKGLQFDIALRRMLQTFTLPGEAQQIERIVQQFAESYCQINPLDQYKAKQLFVLAYAIIMLSTDAHNPRQQKKMSSKQFVNNTHPAAPSLPLSYLQQIYQRITKEEFATPINSFAHKFPIPDINLLLTIKKQLMKGEVFLKICRRSGQFVQRLVRLTQNQECIQWICDPPKDNQKPRFIMIKDIIDLQIGRGSQVMKKGKVPIQFQSLCMTIYTSERSLDLKAKSTKDRGKWMNYIRDIMLQKRSNRQRQMQMAYKSIVGPDIIQEIWNTDIFPHWDTHWDYKQRIPKIKGYIARGMEKICNCFKSESEDTFTKTKKLGIPTKSSLLQTMWCHGLPPGSRKTLWVLTIGNNLALNSLILQDLQKRKKIQPQFLNHENTEIVQLSEIIITLRPDLPAVKQILILSKVFMQVFQNKKDFNLAISCMANLVHLHHFLSFYRFQLYEIQLRIELFQYLINLNIPAVGLHFKGLKIETKMFLIPWFLTCFADCFSKELVLKVWDNFILQGEFYLFKVGITILKYYEIELKMCTFEEGLKMLLNLKQTSSILFMHILSNQINVQIGFYQDYIEKRKNAIIKTKVQQIPLQ